MTIGQFVATVTKALIAPSVIVAAIPIIRFVLERALDSVLKNFDPKLFKLIYSDSRPRFKKKSDDTRPPEAVKAEETALEIYRIFAEEVHVTFQACATAILSILLSQVEYGATFCHSILLIIIIIFASFFGSKLHYKRINPAVEGSVDSYYHMALFLSLGVALLEVALKVSPTLCPVV